MVEKSSEQIPFPVHEFIQRGRDFHLLSFLVILLLLGLSLTSPILKPVLDILIPIFVAIYIVIISTEYALFRNKFVEIESAFRAVFEEIVDNRKRVVNILNELDNLKNAWINLEKDRWIYEKSVVRVPYSIENRFFYQYLPNNAYTVLQSHSYDQIINGARNKQEPNYYHQIARFYFHCVKTSENTQKIEAKINFFLLKLKYEENKNKKISISKYKDCSGNLTPEYYNKECEDYSSFPTANVHSFESGYIDYNFVEPHCDENPFFSENGNLDMKKWTDFIETNVEKIKNCFNLFQKMEKTHCPNLKNLENSDVFFHTIIDQNTFFPPNFFTQIFRKKIIWPYLLLISSVLSIWLILFIKIGFLLILYHIIFAIPYSIVFLFFFTIFFLGGYSFYLLLGKEK